MNKEKKFPMSEKDFRSFVVAAECRASGAALDGVSDRFHRRYNTYYRESISSNRTDYETGWFLVHEFLHEPDVTINFFSLPM